MSEPQQEPPQQQAGQAAGAEAGMTGQPSEEELRAAYEAELSRITSAEVILQTTVSLLNLAGRRLGLAGPDGGERDLEQVRDAIDAVRGLMPVLERRMAKDLGPLRDALSQLQMAFAREAGAAGGEGAAAQPAGGRQPASRQPEKPQPGNPGPAQSSGRLWVPGR
jgi:hypothetical protein